MEAKQSSAQALRTESAGSAFELIICNGRLKGTRRPLLQSMTLIGRTESADLRLNVSTVSPCHCCLVQTFEGLLLRDLHSEGGTQVNGQMVSQALLRDGDTIAVGPFQFQVQVHGPTPAQRLADLQARHTQEKDALRIQAAAVAAQQAALSEQEAKLEQRRQTLQQQEEQLSAHLEEKRQKLLEIRDQARQAHFALKQEQRAHESGVLQSKRELERARRELADSQKTVDAERKRLTDLVARLKKRWDRQWAAERSSIARRQEELVRLKQQLDLDRQQLDRDREALHQARLRFNGEAELSRRQLQSDWNDLRNEQQRIEERNDRAAAELADRSRLLDDRETSLAQVEHELEEQKREWHLYRIDLEREADGLETRIRNYRRKITDLEREVTALQLQRAAQASADAGNPAVGQDGTEESAVDCRQPAEPAAALSEPASPPVDAASAAEAPVTAVQQPATVPASSAESGSIQERLAFLETLSGELADQRLHLMEQWQRLAAAQHSWQQEREAAANQLEELACHLRTREQELQQRELSLQAAESRQRQMQEQTAILQRNLEGWQARLVAREAAWEGDRDRLLAEAESRSRVAEQRMAAIAQVHTRWIRRRKREILWLQQERAACAKLRQECAAREQDQMQHSAALERQQRALAERTLALEQVQQEFIGKSPRPAAAARRIEKLRSNIVALSAQARKAIEVQRQAMNRETADLAAREQQLTKLAEQVTTREAELARRVAAWEHRQLQAHDKMLRLENELKSCKIHRDRYEKQAADLRDEVERLARLLLDEPEPVLLGAARAA